MAEAADPPLARSSCYKAVRANRLAFSKATTVPGNFSLLLEGKIGGMALPTSAEQILALGEQHNVGLVVSVIEIENSPPAEYFEGAGAPAHLLQHWPNYGTVGIAELHALTDAMQATVGGGKAAVCHCFAGKGRTGTLLAAFLIKHGGTASARDAIAAVRAARPGSIEVVDQERVLVDFANAIHHLDEPYLAAEQSVGRPPLGMPRLPMPRSGPPPAARPPPE